MCGIAGFIDISGQEVKPSLLKAMMQTIRHRGPDDEGYVLIDRASNEAQRFSGPDSPGDVRQALRGFDPSQARATNIGIAHRRFSIIDLSSGGHQPFFDSAHTCCLSFNGEIYNYVELKSELERSGATFRTNSDTEVLIEAYKAWGTDCFARFNGFWAIALYDFRSRRLILSRDRLGKRPLYWARAGARVYFASEIKALLEVPEIAAQKRVSRDAVWYWCVDGMRDLDGTTFFENVNNLPAASWTAVDESFPNEIHRYWEVGRERLREADIGVDEAAAAVRETLSDAVRLRMRADVPIGFELSGGLDSSTVLALASELHPGPLRSYTVRFADPKWNEEPFARAVARRYKTDYRVIDPPLDTFWQGIGAFTALQEEPYHSPNMQVSQVIWSMMRAEGTKVTLTGSAGDEMFAGYPHYFWKAQFENLKTGEFRRLIDNVANWSERRHVLASLSRELVKALGVRRLARRAKKMFRHTDNDYLLGVFPKKQYYAGLLTDWLHSDITNTLIPYWLMSGDKTLMGVPFEGRSPFLDYRVVELATRLPITYLIREGWHKWILRKAMEDALPADVVWRKIKMGFPYPYEAFYQKYANVIELILASAHNPYIDLRRSDVLRTDWKALSFVLWYELYFNDNAVLFRKIERMVAGDERNARPNYRPEFLNVPASVS